MVSAARLGADLSNGADPTCGDVLKVVHKTKLPEVSPVLLAIVESDQDSDDDDVGDPLRARKLPAMY